MMRLFHYRQSDARMRHFVHIEDWVAWTADSAFTIRSGHALHERIGESVVPRLLRRRLDVTGRAACDAIAVLDNRKDQPLIHASRHGGVSSSLDMLQALQDGDPVSPGSFAMSVHNAVLGVYSIATQHRGPTLALGACGREFDALVNEARGYLAGGQEAVIVLFSETEIPQSIKPHTRYPAFPCLVALKLTSGGGSSPMNDTSTAPACPTPLDVIRWLNEDGAPRVSQQRGQLERT